MKLFKDRTGVGTFRLTLFVLLILSTVVSAAIAIWAVIANGFENDTTWRALGTSGVIAGASLLLIFLTMTLNRKRWVDYTIVSVGIPAILYLVFTSLDSIYEWNILPDLFSTFSSSDEYGYNKTYENTTITVVIIAATMIATSFMLLVTSNRISRIFALATEILLIFWFSLQLINIWWPELMGTRNQWGNYDLSEGWSKTQVVMEIMLAVFAITTFVLEVVGRSRNKKTQSTHKEIKPGIKTIEVDEETYSTLAGVAVMNDTTIAGLLKDYAKEKDSKQ